MEIDRSSPVAPYQQVAAWLRARILSGDLEPGARLPSAAGLSQEFGVALMTSRKALAVLVEAGYAYRSVGMGTFVTPREQWPA